MQSPTITPAAFQTAPAANANPRVIAACVAVVVIHAALLGVALTMRNEPLPRPIEAKSITAQLISETPQPAPQPVAIETPPPPKPVPQPVPKPQPKPKVKPKIEPKPTPMPVTEAPSQIAAPAPEPTPPAPPQPVAPAAPAIGKPSMDLAAPKNVAHLTCNIAVPEYPPMAKRRGETGTAVVRLTVGLSGKLENITLQKSSGSSRLDDAALEAARNSACSPYKENGEAIRATATQPFVFSLND
ncbi:energy transducer TonB [Caballeronia sp. NK8]|uniref:energy transducer TonB n=1 Tax=Caballeronia sp. NK8 TaxID=140098 RepID=UPI001BB6C2F2|nr:energy transducer TonB [Caballeronia sp. NK8]BCQ22889.1 energy transducer TonB [Caballeronia sp. NK8]